MTAILAALKFTEEEKYLNLNYDGTFSTSSTPDTYWVISSHASSSSSFASGKEYYTIRWNLAGNKYLSHSSTTLTVATSVGEDEKWSLGTIVDFSNENFTFQLRSADGQKFVYGHTNIGTLLPLTPTPPTPNEFVVSVFPVEIPSPPPATPPPATPPATPLPPVTASVSSSSVLPWFVWLAIAVGGVLFIVFAYLLFHYGYTSKTSPPQYPFPDMRPIPS